MAQTVALLVVSVLIFGCVVLALVTLTGVIADRERVRRRFRTAVPANALGDASVRRARPAGRRAIDPARLGIGVDRQRRLRRDLVMAGFFDRGAVGIFALVRLVLMAGLPTVGVAALGAFPALGAAEKILIAFVLALIGFVAPEAFVSRRQRLLQARYRLAFPDLLDMIVVCVNAGLSLDASLDRAARELGSSNAELRANLEIMASERRAGQSTSEALRALAGRLGLQEASSFAGLMQQTIELGTDVAQALTTFSDEMRDRRMSRAEEKAASLPPKLTLPLGLFIFPVVLIVVLAPAVMRVLSATAP